ncbi:MAG: ComEC/Rec2 family competence protein, partial [Actinobacteria bacterium]|nr:ComEC/Rec2 family competence protein [Actinomycetota bacterium]
DPWQGRAPGFALSVLATAGLLLFAPRVITYLERYLPKIIAQAIAAPIAATVFCAPVIVAISGFLSPMSILANLLAAPAIVPTPIVGFIAAL